MAFERIGGFKIAAQSVDTITVTEGVVTVDSSPDGAKGGEIVLKEGTANGNAGVTLSAPAAVAANITLTLPNTTGSAGEFLKTNGSGVMSWDSASSTLTASDILQIQVFS